MPTEQNVKAKALMKKTLDQALTVSKTATASVGKFDKGLVGFGSDGFADVGVEAKERLEPLVLTDLYPPPSLQPNEPKSALRAVTKEGSKVCATKH